MAVVKVIGTVRAACTDRSAIYSSACPLDPTVELRQRNRFLAIPGAHCQPFRSPSVRANIEVPELQIPRTFSKCRSFAQLSRQPRRPPALLCGCYGYPPHCGSKGLLAGTSRRVTDDNRSPGKQLSADSFINATCDEQSTGQRENDARRRKEGTGVRALSRRR